MPNYNDEQRKLWIHKDCPAYTGIMAAVNGIAWKLYGCFVDKLSEVEREIVDKQASQIGMAWFEMPE